MKLNRVIPAFLALSLLTGCDIEGLMAGFNTDGKNGKGGDIVEENQGNPAATWESLTDEEKAVVNNYTDLAIDAAGQGLAAAGTFDALKSVSALTSNSAYRISSVEPTIDLSKLPKLPFLAQANDPFGETGLQWTSPFEAAHQTDNGKFDGKLGKIANDNGTAWYLDGRFAPVQDFATEGQAVFKVSSDKLDMSTISNFQAEAQIDATIKSVPSTISMVTPIKDSRIELDLKKTEATSPILEGTFKLSKDGNAFSEGEITFDLSDDTWSVEIPIQGHGAERLHVRLETQRSGAGQASLYGETGGKIDTDKKRARLGWDKDGKLFITDVYVSANSALRTGLIDSPRPMSPLIMGVGASGRTPGN